MSYFIRRLRDKRVARIIKLANRIKNEYTVGTEVEILDRDIYGKILESDPDNETIVVEWKNGDRIEYNWNEILDYEIEPRYIPENEDEFLEDDEFDYSKIHGTEYETPIKKERRGRPKKEDENYEITEEDLKKGKTFIDNSGVQWIIRKIYPDGEIVAEMKSYPGMFDYFDPADVIGFKSKLSEEEQKLYDTKSMGKRRESNILFDNIKPQEGETKRDAVERVIREDIEIKEQEKKRKLGKDYRPKSKGQKEKDVVSAISVWRDPRIDTLMDIVSEEIQESTKGVNIEEPTSNEWKDLYPVGKKVERIGEGGTNTKILENRPWIGTIVDNNPENETVSIKWDKAYGKHEDLIGQEVTYNEQELEDNDIMVKDFIGLRRFHTENMEKQDKKLTKWTSMFLDKFPESIGMFLEEFPEYVEDRFIPVWKRYQEENQEIEILDDEEDMITANSKKRIKKAWTSPENKFRIGDMVEMREDNPSLQLEKGDAGEVMGHPDTERAKVMFDWVKDQSKEEDRDPYPMYINEEDLKLHVRSAIKSFRNIKIGEEVKHKIYKSSGKVISKRFGRYLVKWNSGYERVENGNDLVTRSKIDDIMNKINKRASELLNNE